MDPVALEAADSPVESDKCHLCWRTVLTKDATLGEYMLTDIKLETGNLKARNFGDPVWIAHIERDGVVKHRREGSPSTQMRLLPLALLEALKLTLRGGKNRFSSD